MANHGCPNRAGRHRLFVAVHRKRTPDGFHPFRRHSVDGHEADLIAVGYRDDADFSSTELFRSNSNCLKHRLKVVWRSGNDFQHFRRGGLLLARFIQFANA